MPAILQYEFMLRALAGGVLVGILAPVLGTFIVLRRYSLIAETLAHVALMGVAIGLATKFLPSLFALLAATIGAILVEQLRARGRLPGDVAMAVVLYGALAFAIVVIGFAGGFNVDLFSFLFGSILSVAPFDLWLLAGLTVVVVLFVSVFFIDLAQIAFDDDLAKVSGVRTDRLNLALGGADRRDHHDVHAGRGCASNWRHAGHSGSGWTARRARLAGGNGLSCRGRHTQRSGGTHGCVLCGCVCWGRDRAGGTSPAGPGPSLDRLPPLEPSSEHA